MTGSKDELKRKIAERTARVHIIGLGYVGLSLAVELAKAGFTVRGIDVDLAAKFQAHAQVTRAMLLVASYQLTTLA